MRELLLVLLVSGCAHRMGDVCAEGDAYCGDSADPKSELSCRDGKLLRFDCLGPKGCTRDEARGVFCDQTQGAVAAQPCLPAYEGRGQCSGAALLQCVHGMWTQVACPAGQACSSSAGFVTCR